MQILYVPVVSVAPQLATPKATLYPPVVIVAPEPAPIMVLLAPVVLAPRAA